MRSYLTLLVAISSGLAIPSVTMGQKPELIRGIEEVFDRPAELAGANGPLVCILDTEHPDTVREKLRQAPIAQYKCRVLQRRVKEITGLPCVLVHHAEVTCKEFERPNLRAILLMARARAIEKQLDQELFALIRQTKVPMIGFCGGLQIIVQAYGGKIDYMRKLKPGESDTNPKYQPGMFKEWGFLPVRAIKSDPLLDGLPEPMIVKEMHAWQVVDLPAEFEVLAETAECKIQIARHRGRPLYGTQFHPEAYDAQHTDGRKLLENFFRIAGVVKP